MSKINKSNVRKEIVEKYWGSQWRTLAAIAVPGMGEKGEKSILAKRLDLLWIPLMHDNIYMIYGDTRMDDWSVEGQEHEVGKNYFRNRHVPGL